MKKYFVLLAPIEEPEFSGYYHAHIPVLDLTTHGEGIEGALRAAKELVELWVAERLAHGEAVPEETTALFAQVEVADAVQGP